MGVRERSWKIRPAPLPGRARLDSRFLGIPIRQPRGSRARFDIIAIVRFLRMKPGHDEVLIAEGDVDLAEDEQRLIEEFRRQLDSGLWAAVPFTGPQGRRDSIMARSFEDIPRDAERVIFFPRAAGGS